MLVNVIPAYRQAKTLQQPDTSDTVVLRAFTYGYSGLHQQLRTLGDCMPMATHELSFEAGAVHDLPAETMSGFAIAHAIPKEAHRGLDARRPAWFSPEIVSFLVGASDFCLILMAAASAFAVYSGMLDLTLAGPGRHVLISFVIAILFVGIFERLGGYSLKQLSRLHWQLMHIVMTWVFAIAMLLLVA